MRTRLVIALALFFVGFAAQATPATGTAADGQTVTFSVTADGTAPFTFQWMKGGVAITGATAQTYVISPVRLADAGVYTVRVSNSAGSALSDTATLTVNAAGPVIRSISITVSVSTGAAGASQ